MRNIIIYIAVLLFSVDANAQIAGVSCCDWMMLKRQKMGAFTLAKQINADGVEMDMGGLGRRILFDNKFRDNDIETSKFQRAMDSLNIKVSSIAMSGFFAQTLIDRRFNEYTKADGTKDCYPHTKSESIANYRALFNECFDTMDKFGAKVAFLPLGGSGREWQSGEGEVYDTLCARLHMVGEMALKRGVVVGIRTAMPAKFSIKMLKDIDSEGIKIYYNFQDACDRFKAGDAPEAKTSTELICHELKTLGAKRICQIHVSNTDRVTLRHDTDIDMPAVKKTLNRIRYKGWLVVERSRNAKDVRNVRGNFGDNVAYLKEVFN
jgi:sugar phosphate isomerase/epimerase